MLSVVMINYGMDRFLIPCLDSIHQSRCAVDMEIVLVSDRESSNSLPERSAAPGLRIVRTDAKFGISRLRNVGIKNARGRYLFFLDIDSKVLPGALNDMVDFMESNPQAGAAGARIVNEDGKLQHTCRRFITLKALLWKRSFLRYLFPRQKRFRSYLMLDWDHETVREVDWVCGGHLIVRRSLLDEVGLWDDAFIFGFEDMDLCRRIRMAGSKIFYFPGAGFVHYGKINHPGFNWKTLEMTRSLVRYYLKKGRG